jgi:hypothetical protein
MSAEKVTRNTLSQSTQSEQEQQPTIYTPEYYLLKGPLPDLSKMTKSELKSECELWRRLWAWVPDEVKYYVARTGKLIGVTQRNYKRYLGVLLETHWDLRSIELGVTDKVYDTVTGKWYYEKKVIRMGVGSLIDMQWIEERIEEEKLGEVTPPPPPELQKTAEPIETAEPEESEIKPE